MAIVSELIKSFEFIQETGNKIGEVPVDDLPAEVREGREMYSKMSSLSLMAQQILSTREALLYRVKDRKRLMKELPPGLTLNNINENGLGFLSKIPGDCVLIRYPRWTTKEIEDGILLLMCDSDDLLLCIDIGLVHENGHHVWTPFPPPMCISMGYHFSKRPDRDKLAQQYFGNPRGLDDHNHYIFCLGDDSDPVDSITEVFTFLGTFFYALNAEGSQTKKVRYDKDPYNMLVKNGKPI